MSQFIKIHLSTFILLCMAVIQTWGADFVPDSEHDLSAPSRPMVMRKSRCVIHPLYFHYDDDVVDMDYMNNEAMMQDFRRTIDSVGLQHVDSIRVIVQSSPEGPVAHNFDLSRRRAINTERYLAKRYPDIMYLTEVRPDGESWAALRRFIVTDTVLSNSDVSYLVDIIDNMPDLTLRKKFIAQRKEAYDYLYKTYYPRLRNSIIASVYTTEIIIGDGFGDRTNVTDTIYRRDTIYVRHTVVVDSIGIAGIGSGIVHAEPVRSAKDSVRHDVVMAIKTNLLFDAVTALNGEIEVPLGSRHSIMAEVIWPWWLEKTHNRWCFQMGTGGLEYRYWLRRWEQHHSNIEWEKNRRQPLRGHFFGVYGSAGYYDFQWKRHNGYQGEFWTGGLTYGYSRYLSPHTRLEFSVGGGYVKDKYRTYHIDNNTEVQPDRDQHLWRDGRKRNTWIGPTKAKISISVLLFKKCNRNRSVLTEQEGEGR